MKRDLNDEFEMLRAWAKYGRLLPGLIHNLNTPLMGINGRVELIQFKTPELKGLDQIVNQLNRINETLSAISFLLDKDANHDVMLVDINDLVVKMDQFLLADMKYKHRINRDRDLADQLLAEIPPCYFLNALYEILRNCIETLDDEGEMLIKSYKGGKQAIIEIFNDGPRVADEILAKIGEPGVTDKDGHAGYGLHLAKNNLAKIGATFTLTNLDDKVLYRIEVPLIR
jgi:signal transduction histidine kinase